MRTHLGCTGSVDLGVISKDTQRNLEEVEATWLEFSPDPASLVIRHVQPDAVSALREIAGELLEFLGRLPDRERRQAPGGALYYLDEQTGQYLRLRVWRGGNLTLSWAHPDYAEVKRTLYEGQSAAVVFEPYQCLNGAVKFNAESELAETLRATIERPGGLYPQGDYEIDWQDSVAVLRLRDVNSNVVPLVAALRAIAKPGSIDGHIEVSSFRAGDLDDYCRFVFEGKEIWLARPSLWNDAPTMQAAVPEPAHRVRKYSLQRSALSPQQETK